MLSLRVPSSSSSWAVHRYHLLDREFLALIGSSILLSDWSIISHAWATCQHMAVAICTHLQLKGLRDIRLTADLDSAKHTAGYAPAMYTIFTFTFQNMTKEFERMALKSGTHDSTWNPRVKPNQQTKCKTWAQALSPLDNSRQHTDWCILHGCKTLDFFPLCLHLMHIYQAPFVYLLLLTSRSSATSCNSSTGFSTLGLKTTNALPASTALKFDV